MGFGDLNKEEKQYYKFIIKLGKESKIKEEWNYNGWRDKPVDDLLTQNDWNLTLVDKINDVNGILKDTTNIDCVIISPEVGAIIEDNILFDILLSSNPSESEINHFKNLDTIFLDGLLDKKYKIYKDVNIPAGIIIIGNEKGLFNLDSETECGIIKVLGIPTFGESYW